VPKQYSAPPPMTIDPNKSYAATLHTTLGDIKVEFFAKEAPKTVNNFVFLAREGFDPSFGARPLKRAIQRAVLDPLALYLLDQEVAEGTRIVVRPDAAGARLTFEAIPPAAGAADAPS